MLQFGTFLFTLTEQSILDSFVFILEHRTEGQKFLFVALWIYVQGKNGIIHKNGMFNQSYRDGCWWDICFCFNSNHKFIVLSHCRGKLLLNFINKNFSSRHLWVVAHLYFKYKRGQNLQSSRSYDMRIILKIGYQIRIVSSRGKNFENFEEK